MTASDLQVGMLFIRPDVDDSNDLKVRQIIQIEYGTLYYCMLNIKKYKHSINTQAFLKEIQLENIIILKQ